MKGTGDGLGRAAIHFAIQLIRYSLPPAVNRWMGLLGHSEEYWQSRKTP